MSYFICPQCGADIETENGNRCEYCGYEIKLKKCVSCGRDIMAGETVCSLCGAPQSTDHTRAGESGTPKTDASSQTYGIGGREVISNVPQSADIMSSAFDAASPQVFGHEEEVEEIIDDYSEDEIIEDTFDYDRGIEEFSTEEEPISGASGVHYGSIGSDVSEDDGVSESADAFEGDSSLSPEEDDLSGSPDESADMAAESGQGLSIGHQEEVQYMSIQDVPAASQKREQSGSPEGRKCGNCGFLNPGIARFCLGCGTQLEPEKTGEEPSFRECPECGFENLPNARFCMVCGSRFSTDGAAEAVEADVVGTSGDETAGEALYSGLVYKSKINFDNNNKFQYKFVFNKIKELNPEVSESELKMLMNNNIFVVDIKSEDFDSFKSELEDLDCTVEKISESVAGAPDADADEDSEQEDQRPVSGYSLLIKGMEGHDDSWKSKFVKMLMLMIPEMEENTAYEIAAAESKRIPMESEDSARDLQKIISRLGCITQIIEHKGQMSEHIHDIPEKAAEEVTGKPAPEVRVKKEKPVGVPSEEAPKYLILSGVDRRNWVVREKLAEAIVEIYPNMTPEIAAGIVSQPVVKLRVKNQTEAETLGSQFENMGWNIRIEDVSTVFDSQRNTSRKRIDVQRRKAARMTYLKRQQRKRTNIITTIIIFLLVSTAGVIVYDTFLRAHYYVRIEAEAAHPEVSILTRGNAVFLRYEPAMDAVKHQQPMFVGEVMELKNKELFEGDGLSWYKVKIPTQRAKSAYLREDVAYRCDKEGRRLGL